MTVYFGFTLLDCWPHLAFGWPTLLLLLLWEALDHDNGIIMTCSLNDSVHCVCLGGAVLYHSSYGQQVMGDV